jgi:septal ring-binding cell division protein DamX
MLTQIHMQQTGNTIMGKSLLMPMLLALLLNGLVLPLPAWTAEKYAIQFIVPSGKDDVWKFVEMISDKGYPAYMFTREIGGEKHYHAHMGTYDSIVEAIDAAVLLQKEVRVEYEIVHANTNKVVNLRKGQERQDQTDLPSDKDSPETLPLPEQPLHDPLEQPLLIAEPDTRPEAAGTEPIVEPLPASRPTPLEKTPETPPAPAEQPSLAPAPQPEPRQEPEPTPATVLEPEPQTAPKATPKPAAPPSVAPAPPIAGVDKLPPPSSTAPQETAFLLQMHSFSVRENALKAAQEYTARGLPGIVVILLYDSEYRPWYIVSLGHYKDKGAALRAAREFEERENRSLTLNEVDANFLETRIVPFAGQP